MRPLRALNQSAQTHTHSAYSQRLLTAPTLTLSLTLTHTHSHIAHSHTLTLTLIHSPSHSLTALLFCTNYSLNARNQRACVSVRERDNVAKQCGGSRGEAAQCTSVCGEAGADEGGGSIEEWVFRHQLCVQSIMCSSTNDYAFYHD
jgi:hypothetical protein